MFFGPNDVMLISAKNFKCLLQANEKRFWHAVFFVRSSFIRAFFYFVIKNSWSSPLKKNFWPFLVSYAKYEVKMSKNHHFCWRQHQNQPTGTFPEIFFGKYRKFSWRDISIPIFVAIACILREKRGGGKFAPPANVHKIPPRNRVN